MIPHPPTTNLTLSGTLGNNSWYTSNVQVNLTATDNEGGSGVNKTEYSFDNATWTTYTNPFNITTEGTTTLYYRSTDNAGNVELTKNQTINIDTTPPTIILDMPTSGAKYLLNENINADFSATDSGSGIATVTATAANGTPIDTGTVGPKTFSVNATDNAGNTANVTANYNVVYNYSGILPPFKPNGNITSEPGSTVPIKFKLWDVNGKNISTATASIYLVNITSGKEINATSAGNANIGNLARYDPIANQYIYNLATKSLVKRIWPIRIHLDDGTVKEANMELK